MLRIIVLMLVFFLSLSANAQAPNCWWDGNGMRCQPDWTWRDHREWRDERRAHDAERNREEWRRWEYCRRHPWECR